jgi:O-antigen ligase
MKTNDQQHFLSNRGLWLLSVTLLVAYTLVISLAPMAKFFVLLRNEVLAMLFWIVICASICMHQRIQIRHWITAAPLTIGLLGMGVIILLQFALGWSTPYGGQILQAGVVLAVGVLTCLCAVMLVERLLIVKSAEQNKLIRAAAWIVLGVATVQAGLAWMQFFELHLQFSFIAILNIGGRAYGNIRQFNLFALLLLLGLAAAAYLLSQSENAERESNPKIIVVLLVLLGCINTAALVMSSSRFGMLALSTFIVLGVWDIRQNKIRAAFLLSIPLVYALFFILFSWLDTNNILPFYGTQRAISSEALSAENNQDRLQIWKAAIELIKENPWFGIGFATGPSHFATDTLGLSMKYFVENAHNLLLQWALEFGIPLAGVLVGLLIYIFYRLRGFLLHSGARLWMLMLILPLMHQMVEYPLNYTYFLLPWCFLASALIAVADSFKKEIVRIIDTTGEVAPRQSISGGFLLCILTFAITTYGYFDAKKPARLFDRFDSGTAFEKITDAYETIAFEQAADYAIIQMVPATREYAPQLERVGAKITRHSLDALIGLAYMQAAALNGNLCVAKSLAYRMSVSDGDTRLKLQAIIMKRSEAEFSEIKAFLQNPYFIKWDTSKKGDC